MYFKILFIINIIILEYFIIEPVKPSLDKGIHRFTKRGITHNSTAFTYMFATKFSGHLVYFLCVSFSHEGFSYSGGLPPPQSDTLEYTVDATDINAFFLNVTLFNLFTTEHVHNILAKLQGCNYTGIY